MPVYSKENGDVSVIAGLHPREASAGLHPQGVVAEEASTDKRLVEVR
jgi:hypothetical protein